MNHFQRAMLIGFIFCLTAAHELRSVVATGLFLALALIAAWLFVNEE